MTDPAADPAEGAVTWRHLLAETAATLGDRQHARWMCETASGAAGEEFVAELDEFASQRMVAHLDAMIARRQAGEPVQYVLGGWQFRSLDLMIDKRVLIPRPETEWVCQVALDLVRASPSRPRRIADLGTGSGAIGLALAAELPVGGAEVWLADVSSDALDVARANLAGLGRAAGSVRIVGGSWFDALPPELQGMLDLAVANPPYIADGDPAVEAAVIDHEPHVALFSGADGLDAIREIISSAPTWLIRGGWLVLEIGAGQGEVVASLLRSAGLVEVSIRPDLAGHDRTALARRALN